MQFHTDGFQVGDPDIRPPATPWPPDLPDEVDVLIVGSGPAGSVLAAQLAVFPEITTRLVERRSGRLTLGQADGIACRSVEMFEAFGFSEKVKREAYWVNETTFWRPAPDDRTRIVRTGRIRDTPDGMSEMPHLIVNQARIQDYLLDFAADQPARFEPDYGLEFTGLTVGEGEHPVTVTLTRTDDARQGEEVTVRTKYVVGCDGARSAVRTAIGRRLEGEAAHHAWGVMDILAVTDFPDWRLKSAIQSASGGNIILIPREGGHLVRIYIDLGELDPDDRDARARFTLDSLIERTRGVVSPYLLDVKEVAWWSVYEVAQRVTDRFDDVDDETAPRVFIAGDACHTHSAKAGQGMNVSMADAFNLGWKLAAVLRGQSAPNLLRTYSGERQPVAKGLIDFDREWSTMISQPPRDPDHPERGGVDPAEVQSYFEQQAGYTAGVATLYPAGPLILDSGHQHLATGYPVGMRFHSHPVIRVSDAKPVQLAHTAKADGRWRLYAFADASGERFRALAEHLAEHPDSPLRRGTAAGEPRDAVLSTYGILPGNHRDLTMNDVPAVMKPAVGRLGLTDYEKAYAPDLTNDIFDARGIDRERGALVVVRPDQYVAAVLPLDDHRALGEFFAAILLER